MSNLALTLRPEKIEDVLGNDHIKRAIRSFAEKDEWPNVFLLYGPPGTGKTTLALIIAQMCGAEGDGLLEVNASTDNGVDAARNLTDISASLPFTGCRRVIILNEAHQLTSAAQNALKDPMEKNQTIWVLTTDRPEKIEPAIKSRAAAATFEVKPLSPVDRGKLVAKVLAGESSTETGAAVLKLLHDNQVSSPREILGILDQVLAGVPLDEAVHGSEHEPLYKDVASSVIYGDWTKASSLLQQIKTADSRGLVAVTSAFLRSELLKTPIGAKADGIATCLVGLDNLGYADGTAYGAAIGGLYKVCKVIAGGAR